LVAVIGVVWAMTSTWCKSAVGEVDNDNNNDNTADPIDDSDGQWPTHVEAWIDRVKKDIDKAVKMTGKENQRRRMGKFPDKYKGAISPSDDPVSFFEGERITRDHFALPNLLVWYPEAQYGPDFYPYGRPPCKWHNEYGCCKSKGWMPHARHGYAMGRTFAIIGRKYYCNVRKEQGKECRFRNIDRRVIENSHDYIRLQWMKIGFDLSRRAAIAMQDLELSRR